MDQCWRVDTVAVAAYDIESLLGAVADEGTSDRRDTLRSGKGLCVRHVDYVYVVEGGQRKVVLCRSGCPLDVIQKTRLRVSGSNLFGNAEVGGEAKRKLADEGERTRTTQ